MSRKGLFGRLFGGGPDDPDIQFGSGALSFQEITEKYLRTPGHLLAILRFFSAETVESVSTATKIPVVALIAYEKGEKIPPLHHLPILADHYRADLKKLMIAFGHAQKQSSAESMGIAAHYGGELTPDERLQLRSLVQEFRNRRR